MRKIERFIKSKLKENSDLIDNAVIDHSLTYEEQQTELRKYINPLMPIEDKLQDLISKTKAEPINKRFIWQNIRIMFN